MYLNATNKLKLKKHLKSNANRQICLASKLLHKNKKIPLEFLKGFFIAKGTRMSKFSVPTH